MWHKYLKWVRWRVVQQREPVLAGWTVHCLEFSWEYVMISKIKGSSAFAGCFLVVFFFLFCFVINSCSTYKLTREGGIYIEKQPMSWVTEKGVLKRFFCIALLIPLAVFCLVSSSESYRLAKVEEVYFSSLQTGRLMLLPMGSSTFCTDHCSLAR